MGIAQLLERSAVIYTEYVALVRAWDALPPLQQHPVTAASPAPSTLTRNDTLSPLFARLRRTSTFAPSPPTKLFAFTLLVTLLPTPLPGLPGFATLLGAALISSIFDLAIERITVALRVAAHVPPLWRAPSHSVSTAHALPPRLASDTA